MRLTTALLAAGISVCIIAPASPASAATGCTLSDLRQGAARAAEAQAAGQRFLNTPIRRVCPEGRRFIRYAERMDAWLATHRQCRRAAGISASLTARFHAELVKMRRAFRQCN